MTIVTIVASRQIIDATLPIIDRAPKAVFTSMGITGALTFYNKGSHYDNQSLVKI